MLIDAELLAVSTSREASADNVTLAGSLAGDSDGALAMLAAAIVAHGVVVEQEALHAHLSELLALVGLGA